MVGSEQNVNGLLDDMAVKIMMIEPGDLSAVGELLEVLEKLIAHEDMASQAALREMARAFQAALQDLIMGELPDTAESYQQLAECISRMQEVRRNSDDQQALAAFSTHLHSIGFKLDPAQLAAGKQGAAGQDENNDLAFLRDKELLECFIDETCEYLSSIEASVLELEKAPGNIEAVNAIFRAFHTIKGTAGSVSLPEISSLAHSIENLLDEVRSGRISMDADVIELVLGVDDSLKLMVAHVQDVYENGVAYRPATNDEQLALISSVLEKKCGGGRPMPEKPVTPEKDAAGDEPLPSPPAGGPPPDFMKDSDLLSGFISEAFEHLESIELNVLELEQNPNDQDIINNIVRPFHTIKGVSGFLNLMTI
ncbi:MAG: Hpt domain-containing protein, partial [Desulfobulbaceae bacterium]|nr:Hpt domain-containing protein [Desulfobulbaceae bacterium]